MGAFIIAAIVAVITLVIAFLQAFGSMMSTTGDRDSGSGWTLGVGLSLATLIAATHWLPHIGW